MIEKYTTGALDTNSYVISNEKNECVIVDPGLNYKLAANEINNKYNVVAIFLTHGHADHIDGITFFKDKDIYISELEEHFLYEDDYNLYTWLRKKSPFKKGDLKIITIKDNDIIELIGKKFKVTSTPGHTRGSICVSYDKKIFSGDTLFKESTGRTDLPTGSASDMQKSLIKLIDLFDDNYIVYPGHDEKTTIKNERQNNSYIIQALKKQIR